MRNLDLCSKKMKKNIQHTILEARSLSLSFEGKSLFNNFSLSVTEGEKVIISGISGSGKTTLMKCFLGLVRPDAGDLFMDGRRVDESSVWSIRTRIGYVPQEVNLGSGRVSDIILRPYRYRANSESSPGEEKVLWLLKQFKLPGEILRKDMGKLSGGEKQRIAVITAILLDRPIYLLDEITTALDPSSKKRVIDYFRKSKSTILAIAHDREFAAIADRTVRISVKRGR
jgi:putative ABC transport system ATP-binding protein